MRFIVFTPVFYIQSNRLKISAIRSGMSFSVAVLRRQPSFYVVFFNLPYIENCYDEVRRIWKYGMVNVKAIYDVDNVGGYVTKYMVKDLEDPRLAGEKCYFVSRGLKKPYHELNIFKVRWIESRLPEDKKVVTEIYNSDFLGEIEYTLYNLGRGGSIEDYGVVIREKEK
ncbi:MAG: Rep protein [Parcubacteria group bacterium GW2011_GWC1_38_6]|nr:MAG: Rep protein [Parcubacteria group bacterium GW2011_GWC1_38_6]